MSVKKAGGKKKLRVYNEATTPPTDPAERAEFNDQQAFMALALERFKLASEAESAMREESLDDLKFLTGDQWPSGIKAQRSIDGRPCLTLNRLPQFKKQITNEQRQQRPSIIISPVGDGADKDTAEVFQGMIRHIEVSSDAEVVYDTAFEQMAGGGFSFFRIVTEYGEGMTFDQEIKIKRIENQFSVFMDPTCVEPDKSDAEFCFITQDYTTRRYKQLYPKSEMASREDFTATGAGEPDWVTGEKIRVAEYFYVEYEKITIYLLADGTVTDQKPETDEMILKTREMVKRQVRWAKINAIETLEKNDWAGRYIPVISIVGDETNVDGKRHVTGIVRYAKDPQRMYNYWCSAATEQVALSSKAPWLMAIGQAAGREKMWEQSNTRNFAYLEYNPVDIGGRVVGPPSRNAVEPPLGGITRMIAQADNDLKATTGIYDASLGQPGPDQSGKAIMLRQKQGDINNLNYVDNFSRSMRNLGRQLVNLIPKIYDAPRVQRIIAPDQTINHVGVYNSKMAQMSPGEVQQLPGMEGMKRIYDIGVGSYDVTVSTGPSFQTKRQEAVSSMLAVVNSYPQLMQAAGDLILRNMDWPGADKMADRLRAMLPAVIQQMDSEEDPKAALTQMQAKMQEMLKQHEMLTRALDEATTAINTKKLDLESKERMNALNAQVQILVAQAKIEGESALTAMRSELEAINNRLMLLHENETVNGDEQPASPSTESPSGGQ